MPRATMDLSCVPFDEPCAQVSWGDSYVGQATKECVAYIGLLKRVMGNPPTGARLKLKFNPHDSGTYLSVICEYDPRDEKQAAYAFKCEGDGPANWDQQARDELGLVAVL